MIRVAVPFKNSEYDQEIAAWSVSFDVLILEIKFLFFKNTVKILKFM